MRAMIFAAGLGTRLLPLTANCPKALVEVAGKTLLERAIENLKRAGIKDIAINIHHFGDQIIDFLQKKNNFEINIYISDEREELLDTGGGIAKAASFLIEGGEPILIYNVDIISNINISFLADYHRYKKSIATLAVRNRQTSRYFLFDNNMQLSGWQNISTGEKKIVRDTTNYHNFAFSGIHIIEPTIFDLITESEKFSVVDLYLRLASDFPIFGFSDESELWMDLGKPKQLAEAERYFAFENGIKNNK